MTPLPPPPKPTETSSATRFARAALLMSMVATLAACGSGGGGDGDGGSPPPPPPPPPPSGSAVISGTATFESIPSIAPTAPGVPANAGGLNYAGASDKPIRGATVQLIAAGGAVLGSTTTDATGAYSITLASLQPVTVRVRAELKRTDATNGNRDIAVQDNTSSNATYVLDSAAFTPATATVTTNLRAASGWGGTSYTGARAAGPFAILDTVYNAQAKIQSVAPVDLPALRIFWSVNNRPVDGTISTGAIGTSYFTSDSSGNRMLYLLGAENTDTDEYDTHVVAHEFGHYLQSALSRDDSVGGSHGGGDKLDQRVAFSEGWGNGWSGIALGGPVYSDSNGAMQAANGSFTIDVSQLPTSVADRGAYSEDTAQYLVYTSGTSSTIGFAAVYSAFTSLKTSPYWTTVYNFAAGLKGPGGVAPATIDALWNSVNTVATDALGTGETNNGGNPLNLPVYKIHTAGTGVPQVYCVRDENDPTQDGNKLGEFAFIRFTVAAGSHTFLATKNSAPGATDPDFVILKSDGTSVAFESGTPDSETSTAVTLSAGTYTAALTDFNIPANHNTCLNFTVN